MLPILSAAKPRPFSIPSMDPQLSQILKIGRLNHIALAVPQLEDAITLWKSLVGESKVSSPHEQPDHGVYTVFIELENTKLELIHPLGEKSPISNFLKKNPSGGIHHVCVEVPDVTIAIKHLKENSIRTLADEPKIGAHGNPIVFLHPKDCNGVLVELEQVSTSS